MTEKEELVLKLITIIQNSQEGLNTNIEGIQLITRNNIELIRNNAEIIGKLLRCNFELEKRIDILESNLFNNRN